MKRFFATTCAVALLGLTTPLQAATPADTLVIVREISSISDWDPAVSQILDVQEINQDISKYGGFSSFKKRLQPLCHCLNEEKPPYFESFAYQFPPKP